MFLIIGTNPVRKMGTTIIRCNCPRCGDIRNFQEVTVRQFLTFFFIPVFPISKATPIYVCPTCKFGMAPEDAIENAVGEAKDIPVPALPASAAEKAGPRALVFCPRCEGPMYLATSERRQEVICPHCSMEFTVKGVKGKIPEALPKEAE